MSFKCTVRIIAKTDSFSSLIRNSNQATSQITYVTQCNMCDECNHEITSLCHITVQT